MTTKIYHVPGISCGHCTKTIERELQGVAGVQKVQAEEGSKQVTVEVAAPEVLTQVEATLQEIGYPAA